MKLKTKAESMKEMGGKFLIVKGIRKKEQSIPIKVVKTRYCVNLIFISSFITIATFVKTIDTKLIPRKIK